VTTANNERTIRIKYRRKPARRTTRTRSSKFYGGVGLGCVCVSIRKFGRRGHHWTATLLGRSGLRGLNIYTVVSIDRIFATENLLWRDWGWFREYLFATQITKTKVGVHRRRVTASVLPDNQRRFRFTVWFIPRARDGHRKMSADACLVVGLPVNRCSGTNDVALKRAFENGKTDVAVEVGACADYNTFASSSRGTRRFRFNYVCVTDRISLWPSTRVFPRSTILYHRCTRSFLVAPVRKSGSRSRK